MSRNKKLLIVISVLVLVIIGLSYFTTRNSSYDEQMQFTVVDTASVNKIFFADKTGRKVLLRRMPSGVWFVNDSILANRPVIDMILKTLNMQMVDSPSPKSSKDFVMSRLASGGVKVEIYQNAPLFSLFGHDFNVKERLTKTFYVGDPTMDQFGTIMISEGKDKPYIVYMPGLRGNVTSRYSCNEDDWRDHTIFGFTADKIKSIQIEYPLEPEESFKYENIDNNIITVSDLNSGNILKLADTLTLIKFVNSFSRIKYETLFNKMTPTEIDSVRNITPFSIITVTPFVGKPVQCKTVYLPGDKVGWEYIQNEKWIYDKDHFVSLVNNDREVVLCQFYVFDKIFFRKSDFIGVEK